MRMQILLGMFSVFVIAVGAFLGVLMLCKRQSQHMDLQQHSGAVAGCDQSIHSELYTNLLREVVLNSIYHPKDYNQDGTGGSDGLAPSFSMLGRRRLDNFQQVILRVHEDGVDGDIMETGVWKGGASLFAAGVLFTLQEPRMRNVYMCDTFSGIPKPPVNYGKVLSQQDQTAFNKELGFENSPEEVLDRAKRLMLPTSNLHLVQGKFAESLPKLLEQNPGIKLSVLRLDGDTYFSTMDVLNNMYASVVDGGFIIVDDFPSWKGCVDAILDYRRQHNITDPIVTVHHAPMVELWHGVYWRKGGSLPCLLAGQVLLPWDPVKDQKVLPRFKSTAKRHFLGRDSPIDRMHRCARLKEIQ